LLGPAPRRVLEALSGHAADRLVEDALARGLLLREGGRVGLHQLWEALLRERLRRGCVAAIAIVAIRHSSKVPAGAHSLVATRRAPQIGCDLPTASIGAVCGFR